MGIPLLGGRDVAASDTQQSPFVAVVSASFARRHWPDQNPIGRRFHLAFFERTVVGVVGDVRVRGLERDSEPPDVSVLAASGGLVMAVALAGSLLPAFRATRVDPISAIRAD
jgi:hypothetical protein